MVKGRIIMPEKKSGIAEFFKGMFKMKKPLNDDIVYQAEKIIADYVARRRNEIIAKYHKKKSKAVGFVIFASSLGLVYFVYNLII